MNQNGRQLYHVTGDVTASSDFSVFLTSSTWTAVSEAMSASHSQPQLLKHQKKNDLEEKKKKWP